MSENIYSIKIIVHDYAKHKSWANSRARTSTRAYIVNLLSLKYTRLTETRLLVLYFSIKHIMVETKSSLTSKSLPQIIIYMLLWQQRHQKIDQIDNSNQFST